MQLCLDYACGNHPGWYSIQMDPNKFLNEIVKTSPQQTCFFHFTDSRNLASIKRHGILSTRMLRQKNISMITGGNDISLKADLGCGMDAYVHLSFLGKHPMEYRAKERGDIQYAKYLEILPDVIFLPGVRITDGVANRRDVTPKLPHEGIDALDLEVIYHRTNWRDGAVRERKKAAEKCEILVPRHIPVEYIRNL